VTSPSFAHERRLATLEALAVLAGYTEPAALPGVLPDVLLARGDRLFLGEAKATETPGSAACRERLSRYVRHLHRLGDRGLLVLCVGGQPQEWADVLRRLSEHIAHEAWSLDVRALTAAEWLVAARVERPYRNASHPRTRLG
jgi:hypothetical protein